MFTARFLVFGPGVYVADPDEIRELFTGDQSDLRAGEANAPLSPILGQSSVLVLDGPDHIRQRKLLLPPFQGSAVQSFREVIREVSASELSTWRPGDEFPIRSKMRGLTFEVICRAVFGVTEQNRIERLREALLAVIDTGNLFLLPARLRADVGGWSPGGVIRYRLDAADALLYDEIARRRGEGDLADRSDVLSLLLQARDEDGQAMTDQELRDELFTMLAAGHETTSTGLAFAFDFLMRHPHVADRLRSEPADDSYLDAVVSETLRLRPVIDAVERTLAAPRTIGGWELPAGIRVYPAAALVQRREDIYPSAGEFRPERFLDAKTPSYAWIPFGGGVRRCIGAALAQAEMAEVVRAVVEAVDLEPMRAEPDPVILRGITLTPKYGTPVRVRARARKPERARVAAAV